ncbi:MAG: hypothetical protein DLM50_04480 [Candidatus Meridianibacter frigidus]|nr:MAG: hypothetical protein DLM50_04480 [Candidatus Eremiobacteraeota bacterium]
MNLAFWIALLLSRTEAPPPLPALPVSSGSGPIYVGNPATRFVLESRPLGFDPDGNARWLVVVRFLDAQNAPTRIMLGSNVDYRATGGTTQWQPRMRFGQPAAIVSSNREGRISLTAVCTMPRLGEARARTDPRVWKLARTVAAPLGPHAIQIGWFPRASAEVRITRFDARGNEHVAVVSPPSSNYLDATVRPARMYRYVVRVATHASNTAWIRTPPEMPTTSRTAISGKGMWLSFGTNPYDDHYAGELDPSAVVDQAARAGLHYVELRLAYGAYWQLSPDIKVRLDALVDGLAARGIKTVAWTVPRAATFEDLAQAVHAAMYRTAHGTAMSALAVDLERGDEFMHDCPQGCSAMETYIRNLRAAVGPNYTVIATVEDPFLEHLDNDKYPYRVIAQYSDVLQPMTYWRMLSKGPTNAAQVQRLLADSYRTLAALSTVRRPINIGGQTTPEGARGATAPDEISASLQEARALGAIGESFFDWSGTSAPQWDAIAGYPWN